MKLYCFHHNKWVTRTNAANCKKLGHMVRPMKSLKIMQPITYTTRWDKLKPQNLFPEARFTTIRPPTNYRFHRSRMGHLTPIRYREGELALVRVPIVVLRPLRSFTERELRADTKKEYTVGQIFDIWRKMYGGLRRDQTPKPWWKGWDTEMTTIYQEVVPDIGGV